MICPRCGHNDPNAVRFCSMCGTGLTSEQRARPKSGRGMIMVIAVAVAAIIVLAGITYLFPSGDRVLTVKLISDGRTVDSKTVEKGDIIDPWLQDVGDTLTDDDLYFAGWYTDASYSTAFYGLLPIEKSMTLYAQRSGLAFTMTVTDSAINN